MSAPAAKHGACQTKAPEQQPPCSRLGNGGGVLPLERHFANLDPATYAAREQGQNFEVDAADVGNSGEVVDPCCDLSVGRGEGRGGTQKHVARIIEPKAEIADAFMEDVDVVPEREAGQVKISEKIELDNADLIVGAGPAIEV